MFSYAETHYKFRLPWSPIHRPFPEILADAPSRVVQGQKWPLWWVIRNGHLFPGQLHLKAIRHLAPHQNSKCYAIHHSWEIHSAFQTLEIPLEAFMANVQGRIQVDAGVQNQALPYLECGRHQWILEAEFVSHQGKRKAFWNHNLPKLDSWPLQVEVLQQRLDIPNFVRGETHCHTQATSDQVEFGPPPKVYQDTAQALGLDFVLTTDHSYDFAWDPVNYLDPVDPYQAFSQYKSAAEAMNAPGKPLMIWGEEVSCGNALGENIHLIVSDHSKYIVGQGDGGRRWFQNHPDLKISEVLDAAEGQACFAAHPTVPMGKAEKWIFRRGSWSQIDVDPRLSGLQFLSGKWSPSTDTGLQMWMDALQAGLNLRAIGGSDAHGDLNRCAGIAIPLWSLKSHSKHLFGRSWTALPSPIPSSNPSASSRDCLSWKKLWSTETNQAFAQKTGFADQSIASEGPWIQGQFEQFKSGELTWQAGAIPEDGMIYEVLIYMGCPSGVQSQCLYLSTHQGAEVLAQIPSFRESQESQTLEGTLQILPDCRWVALQVQTSYGLRGVWGGRIKA